MKAFIVYCHPSEESFTSHIRDSFIKGIVDSGNEYEISDLYKMNFKARLEQFGLLDSMKKVMLGDRLFNRVKQAEFVAFTSTSREKDLREKNWESNLQKAYEIGRNLF